MKKAAVAAATEFVQFGRTSLAIAYDVSPLCAADVWAMHSLIIINK
jgi:hypothetical protein